MTPVVPDRPGPAVWVALRLLDQPGQNFSCALRETRTRCHGDRLVDDEAETLQEICFPAAATVSEITKILSAAFGLNDPNLVLKMRNVGGSLIPLNASMPANSKHTPHVLEVTRLHQNVQPKPRTFPVTVVSRRMKTRLQAVDRRIQRLDELLPQVKVRRHQELNQEIEGLSQKLNFLCRKLQEAESQRWRGSLTRAPLW